MNIKRAKKNTRKWWGKIALLVFPSWLPLKHVVSFVSRLQWETNDAPRSSPFEIDRMLQSFLSCNRNRCKFYCYYTNGTDDCRPVDWHWMKARVEAFVAVRKSDLPFRYATSVAAELMVWKENDSLKDRTTVSFVCPPKTPPKNLNHLLEACSM